jgi:hypothetical protein
MFPDLYRSSPHRGMIYVATKSLRSIKLLWWKLPHLMVFSRSAASSRSRSAQPERGRLVAVLSAQRAIQCEPGRVRHRNWQ